MLADFLTMRARTLSHHVFRLRRDALQTWATHCSSPGRSSAAMSGIVAPQSLWPAEDVQQIAQERAQGVRFESR